MDDLDPLDVKILGLLQSDCKQSLAAIGEAVGLSAPSVLERVRKLEKNGVIRGYHAVLDGRKVGLDVTAFVGVTFNFPRDIANFERELREIREVLEVHHVTGGPTMLVKVKCKNTAALESVLGRLRMIEGVQRTETMVVLSTTTERIEIPLPETTAHELPLRARGKRARGAA
jgi:Lrp/AsnC family transcriptional regulator, leucine-responsive regulatory protein